MSKLYFDCETGISGDMTVAALLDLGADEEVLRKVLSGVKDDGFHIVIRRVKKAGIDCCDFDVVLDKDHENSDHDMVYLYGGKDGVNSVEEPSGHTNIHNHHGHTHMNEHEHHGHRTLAEVLSIIDSLDMTDNARSIAKNTFDILAKAEAKAHGTTPEEVHFHEVGAIDSIVDIVSAAVCLDNLNVDGVIVTKLCDGQGTVRTRHGVLQIPVPAVMNIITDNGLKLEIRDRMGEYITPTGAAFAAATVTERELPEGFVPVKVGLGAGKRDHEVPGILRAILIE